LGREYLQKFYNEHVKYFNKIQHTINGGILCNLKAFVRLHLKEEDLKNIKSNNLQTFLLQELKEEFYAFHENYKKMELETLETFYKRYITAYLNGGLEQNYEEIFKNVKDYLHESERQSNACILDEKQF